MGNNMFSRMFGGGIQYDAPDPILMTNSADDVVIMGNQVVSSGTSTTCFPNPNLQIDFATYGDSAGTVNYYYSLQGSTDPIPVHITNKETGAKQLNPNHPEYHSVWT